MDIHFSININRVMDAISSDENVGFCTACGEERRQVEPDARMYTCDCCGEKAVFGAEELLLHLS
jgi:hypothetical protein